MRGIVLTVLFSFFLSTAEAAYLDLAWSPNEEPDLAGYRIYYGTSSREYIGFVDAGRATTFRLDNLLDDVTYFVAITAYDTAGNESDFSAEAAGVGSPDSDAPTVSYGAGGGGGGGCFVSTLLEGS